MEYSSDEKKIVLMLIKYYTIVTMNYKSQT